MRGIGRAGHSVPTQAKHRTGNGHWVCSFQTGCQRGFGPTLSEGSAETVVRSEGGEAIVARCSHVSTSVCARA